MTSKALVKSPGLAKTNRTAIHMAAQFDRAAQLFNEGLARLTADYKERCRRAMAEEEPPAAVASDEPSTAEPPTTAEPTTTEATH
jgi:hypothetical protein